MSPDELREAFLAIVGELAASYGTEFLPEGFPRDYANLTTAGMLELVLRHPELFAPKELRPAQDVGA